MHEAHFPGRAPIDAYGNGGFRFADMSHKGSLMCLPSGIYAWDIAHADDLKIESFSTLFSEAQDIEILLIGSGGELVPIKRDLRSKLQSVQISADAMSTSAAVRTYNAVSYTHLTLPTTPYV